MLRRPPTLCIWHRVSFEVYPMEFVMSRGKRRCEYLTRNRTSSYVPWWRVGLYIYILYIYILYMSGDGHQSIPRNLYPTRMDDHKPHIQSSFDHGNLLYNQPPFHDFFHDPSYRIKGMATSAGSRLFLYTGVPFKEVEMSLDIFTAGCFIFVRGVLTLKVPRTNVASWEIPYKSRFESENRL